MKDSLSVLVLFSFITNINLINIEIGNNEFREEKQKVSRKMNYLNRMMN